MKATIKSNRTMGIEIEFLVNGVSMESLTSQMNTRKVLNSCGADNYVREEPYNHETRTWWKIVPDVSAQWELVSPILKGKDGIKQARIVIDALNKIDGVTINSTCGVHVHVGSEDATAKKVGNLLKYWAKNEAVVDSVLAPSRRNSSWAQSLIDSRIGGCTASSSAIKRFCNDVDRNIEEDGTIEGLYRRITRTRRKSINLKAYLKYRTIEFRGHGASMDSEKVTNWAIMLTSLVDRCYKLRSVSSNKMNEKKAFKQMMGCTTVTERFFRNRAEHFGFTQFKNDEVEEVAWCELNDTLILQKLSNGGFALRNIETHELVNDSVKQTTIDILESNGVERDWSRMNTRAVGNLALMMEGVS